MSCSRDSTGAGRRARPASSGSRRPARGGVSTSPGQMQLAAMATASRHGARQAVSRTTPALATAYSGEWWSAVPSPAVEAMLMIAPPPRSRIGARTSCVASMTARRFRSSARSHLARSASGMCRFLGSPRVVDQHADQASHVHRRADAGPVSEVGADERATDPFGQNRTLPVVEVGDDHVQALGGEPLRDPGAYPVRTSRHQCGHSVEFHGGIVGPGTDIPFRVRPGVRM